MDASGRSEQSMAVINSQLNSLLDASKRMGRKDWVTMAIGTVITLAFQLALPPETVRHVFEILKQTLTGIVQLAPQIIATGQHLT